MIKIRGIVKAAQTAQDNLKVGISAQNVPSFQKFITSSVETIEQLCASSNTTPHQLPARSREAYYFLKCIDLDNLPVASGATPTSEQIIRLKNIKMQQNVLLEKIFNLASSTPNSAQIEELTQILTTAVTSIERICARQQASPANLTSSSRQIYAWMKFLTDKHNLLLHLQITHRLRQIVQQICSKHSQDVKVVIELTNTAALYKSKRVGNTATLIISEGFINASDEVLQALVEAAVFGRSQQTTRLVKNFASSEEYSDVLVELDLIVEAIAENSQGKCYNLDNLFDKVNREYFADTLAKPRLVWSQIHSYRKLGHYEPARDKVVMSSTLDDAKIPEFVVEFILYHELLHKYHGEKWVNNRRMVHTAEFRSDERKFKLYLEVEEWLKKLASGFASGVTPYGF